MRVQVLLTIVQDRISKEEVGDLLDQRVQVVATTQELRHSTQNCMRLTKTYLSTEGTLSRVMKIWSRHIDCFKRQYVKSFAGNRLFGEDKVEKINKRVQVFLHSCNTTSLEDVETGALAEFGEIQR